MQRYRINYNWLIGVFATTLVLAIVAFFVHRWQVERKAGYFLTKAEEAQAAGQDAEAFDFYSKYVKLRRDEEEAAIRMGEAAAVVIKSKDATREEQGLAYQALDQTVRTTGNSNLRRELAKIVIGFRPQDAISHLEILLEENPKDPELNAMMIRASAVAKDYKRVKLLAFNFVGYDQKSDDFNAQKTAMKGEPEIYAILAEILVQQDENRDLARRVIDQMVIANPESAQAHLQKSSFLSGLGEQEEAVALLDKAYELDPKDATILSRKGMAALYGLATVKDGGEETKEEKSEEEIAEEAATIKANTEEAKTYFALGLKEHPDNVLFYRLMAQAEQRLENTEGAIAILDQGIRVLDKNQSIDIVISKIDLLFSQEDYKAVNREIKRLTQLNRPELLPTIDFQKARVHFRKKDWAKASRELKRVRPLLYNRPRVQVLAGTMLGVCYESQGIHDLAKAAYKTVLGDYPNHIPAQKGMARMEAFIKPQQGGGIELDRIINEMVDLPESEQDWGKVDRLVGEVVAERKLGIAREKLIRAKIFMKRGKFEEARALILQAAKDAPKDIDVHFAAILLVTTDPQKGSAVGIKMLDRLEKKWGVSLRSLAQRAELLSNLRPNDVTEQLHALVGKAGDLTEAEKRRLDNVLGLKFERLGKPREARTYFEKSAAAEPNNLPIRMHLFDLALREKNDAAMQKAQAAILDFVKSKDHPNYILTETKRQIVLFSQGEIDRDELAKSVKRLDLALRERGEWHELHIVYGQVLLLIKGDMDLALKHFDQALESGPAKSNAVRIQVRLLAQRGLYAQARERMNLLDKAFRGQLLGRLEAEILLKTGDLEAGFIAAEQLATSQPNNSATQVWFSKISRQSGKLDLAAKTLHKALEINPADPDHWLQLVSLYAEQKKFEGVEDVIREAHLASDAEFLPLLTGKYYELLGRWQNAESIYLAAYADQHESLSVSHRLAEFYLLWSAKDKANFGKAATYINRILRAANEGKAAPNNPQVVWARQRAAQLLVAKNDYQNSLKAEQLLRRSAVNQIIGGKELELLTSILISRNDPKSLLEAKKLLAEQRKQGRLSKNGALQLARLYSRTDQLEESNSLMLDMLVKYSSDPMVQTTYVEMLLDQGEYSSAENRIKRMQKLAPNNPALIPLQARLASEKGDQGQLNRLLTSLVPKTKGQIKPQQLKNVLGVAQLAERYGDYELAGKLYKVYAARVPEGVMPRAQFLAYHGDCHEALVLMKSLYRDQTDAVIQLANRMTTVRRDEVGDKYDELIDRLLDSSLREDPDSVTRQLARAEAYETQGKHEESVAAYDQLLQRDDLPTRVRAAAMNNLGFQLGLLNLRLDEAEQLVDDAMEIFGPVEDMLDTRAVVRIALGKYDLAIKDMELALSVSQDPVKYYHLAKACIMAGEGQAAQVAWEKAQELGFEKKALPKLEKADFEQIRQQIESFQG